MRAARIGGLPSSGGEAAYNRAEERWPTEYAEYAEIQKAEIDAEGIKIHGKRGNTGDRDRCRRHKTIDEVKPRNPSASKFSFPCFPRIP
jgi:hypothetical protein